jgi:hypothetical protein
MKNDIRLKRLKRLKRMLDNHDKLFTKTKFNINGWCLTKVNKKGEVCNTAACALGSACLYKPFMKEGLKLDGNNLPTYKRHEEFDAGAKFFGITDSESNYLFSPSAYNSSYLEKPIKNVKPKHVALRVQELIKQYKPKKTKKA